MFFLEFPFGMKSTKLKKIKHVTSEKWSCFNVSGGNELDKKNRMADVSKACSRHNLLEKAYLVEKNKSFILKLAPLSIGRMKIFMGFFQVSYCIPKLWTHLFHALVELA